MIKFWKQGVLVKLGRWEFCFNPFRWNWPRKYDLCILGSEHEGFCYRFGPFQIEKEPE